MAWPPVEIEMALLLGHLLGAGNEPAMAVFRALRRSSAQREAIMEAAKFLPNTSDIELLSAMLVVHKSIEAERNALAHGHFGTSSALPQALIWQRADDYISFRAHVTLSKTVSWNDDIHKRLLQTIYVYRADDLKLIYVDIKMLAHLWYDTIIYLQSYARSPSATSELYARLSGQPRIAAELEALRQKKARASNHQSHPQAGDG
jgi:hypothetical protein